MEMFLASLSTGGLVEGSYSTLDKAKAAVEAHYHLIRGDRPDMSGQMVWWPFPGAVEWRMVEDAVPKYPRMPRNSTPDGILEQVIIYILEPLDSPLPMV